MDGGVSEWMVQSRCFGRCFETVFRNGWWCFGVSERCFGMDGSVLEWMVQLAVFRARVFRKWPKVDGPVDGPVNGVSERCFETWMVQCRSGWSSRNTHPILIEYASIIRYYQGGFVQNICILVFRCFGISVFRCFGISVFRCSVLRYFCFVISVLRCFGISVFRCSA